MAVICIIFAGCATTSQTQVADDNTSIVSADTSLGSIDKNQENAISNQNVPETDSNQISKSSGNQALNILGYVVGFVLGYALVGG